MDNNSRNLIYLFHEIADKGFIKGIGKSWGNIGLTFENEIGKSPDCTYNPDYNDIEIKCSSRYSRYPIYLFTVAFDSNINEVQKLAEKYGRYDKDFTDKKVLFKKVQSTFTISDEYNFIFDIDRKNKKIYLSVFNSKHELLEKEAYITFDTIEKHINTKLKKIAIVKASKKIVNNETYFRYYYLALYTFKDFDTFIELIEKNLLRIDIISRISKSGAGKGKNQDKNIIFSIKKENIPLLFDCYYEYNYDNIH